MKKIQIGDVFEIETPKGKGYFQYVYHNKAIGELIRILPGLYFDEPDFPSITMKEELYFCTFPFESGI